MNKPVKWAAELEHVREVSLLGTADLAFWKDRLLTQDLLPIERDGQAQLLIVAADSKFKGIRFRELSFSVLVARLEDETRQEAAYLEHAFNSNRFLAFCERVFFSTPYSHGDVGVSAALPASIRLVSKGEVAFLAEMRAGGAREPSRRAEEGWEGPIFLPGRGKGRPRKLFFGRLRGDTRTYAFLPAEDSLAIRPSPHNEIFQALTDSHFAPKEWIVREDATHAKSKTYKRSAVFG